MICCRLRLADNRSLQPGIARKLAGLATAAVAAVSRSTPFTEIAEDETAIAVLAKPAGVVEHHAELLIFELAARFELLKIDVLQSRIVRFQNANAPPLSGLNFLEISATGQQRNGCVEPMVFCFGELPPGFAKNLTGSRPA